MTRRSRCGSLMVAAALALACGVAPGCRAGETPDAAAPGAAAPNAAAPGGAGVVAGWVTIDGSSTVLPVARMMSDAFRKAHPGVQIELAASGTGSGLEKLCAGEIDISAASRPINAAESRQCRDRAIEFIELPIAFDSLSVVVSAGNTFVGCLTVDELKRLWQPAAQGTVTRWDQVRSSFPAQPLTLFGPGADSGTFDYFTLAIVGTERGSRTDYTKSEDDAVLAKAIAADDHALGYFGYAYYLANKDTLKLVAVDNGAGCVTPSMETVAEHRYQPLSRPMFFYVSTSAVSRPEVKAFAHFVLAPESARYVIEVGYMPLPIVTTLAMSRRLDTGVTGSQFGGRGSVLGVTAETFQDEERIRNALVR